jgi:hybrid cluster-associated redox disulfide protein
MEHLALSPHTLVADLLAASPLAAGVLVELRVDCVGCSMSRFCTLQEMCRQYELNLETVLKQVKER